ncbi:MAG: transcriptional regulator [Cuniculiplasma sp.]
MVNEGVGTDDLSKYLLSQLAEEITNTPFKSSIRLIILMSLGVSRKMNLTDLMKMTGCGKGSISNHINKLESSGFVIRRDVSFFTSPRIIVEITKKGEIFYNNYLNMLGEILTKFRGSPDSPRDIDSDDR